MKRAQNVLCKCKYRETKNKAKACSFRPARKSYIPRKERNINASTQTPVILEHDCLCHSLFLYAFKHKHVHLCSFNIIQLQQVTHVTYSNHQFLRFWIPKALWGLRSAWRFAARARMDAPAATAVAKAQGLNRADVVAVWHWGLHRVNVITTCCIASWKKKW